MKKKNQNKEEKNNLLSEIFGEKVVSEERSSFENTIESKIQSLNKDYDKDNAIAESAISHSIEKGKQHNENDPTLSSNDIDADWQNEPSTTGEEDSFGSNPTPDQDQVDSLSRPWGTEYGLDEELNISLRSRKLEDSRNRDEKEKPEGED